MGIINTTSLNKIYDENTIPVHAVNNIDIEFNVGEFTAIIGPSGCGKTTLLNLIGGLDKPTSGKVIIDGINISQLSSHEIIEFRLRNVGFVFQAYNLIPVLTARENVEFIMQLQGIAKEDRDTRIKTLFEQIELTDKMDVRPGKLSGGQQQRVAVARALAPKPKFILADEPTANLDTKSTNNLIDIMLKLNQTEKMTFIFSTHDSRVIQRARRLIYLEDGKLIKDEIKN